MAGSEHIAWLKQRLGAHITEIPVQGDQPLLLDDPSCAYVTLSEQHQLFCVGFENGKPHGRREHLARCAPGQVVFGLEPKSGPGATVLLLSGVTGSVVWRLPTAALIAQKDGDGRALIAQLFDRWIELLIATLPDVPVPTRYQTLRAGETVEASADRALRAEPGQLVWVAPNTALSYRGLSPADFGLPVSCWPVTESAWLASAQEHFKVWTTEEMLGSSSGTRFADGFHAFLIAVVSRKRAALMAQRLMRDGAAQSSEFAELGASFMELAAVGSGRRLQGDRLSGDAFARACQRIFAWLELAPPPQVVAPRSTALPHMQAALGRIAGVRTRAVLLEPEFWRGDAGPLLAFLREDEGHHHPVALLPRGRGYELYDPRSPAPRALDAALAAQLEPQAYQFYRTLPRRPLGPLSVLRFSSARVRPDVARVAAIGLGGGLVGTLVPLLTGLIFDRIIPGAERGLLSQLVLLLLGIFAGSFLFDVARGLALVRVQTRMDAALEAAVWDRLLALPLPFFRDYSAGDLASRALGIGSIREVLSQAALSSVLGAVFSLWNFALLFYFDLRLALVASVLVVVAGGVAGLASYYELMQRRRVSELDGRIQGLLLQLFSGIAKLRVSASENRAFAVWARLFARRRDADLAGERIGLRVSAFDAAFPLVCAIALYALVAGEPGTSTFPALRGGASAQGLSTGEFLAFNAAFSAFLRAFLDMIGAGLSALSAIPLYERARPILTSPLESQGHGDSSLVLRGAVEVSHVSFRYQASAPLVLDDVTLRIEPGEFVAIVGASGSGKSTLLRVLLGFEVPSEGGVYYDGQALSGLDVRSVRQQIGVVLQHSQLMAGDIYSNLVGSSGLTLDDAWRAAKQAAVAEDIEAMPMAMHTVITAGGGTLSGGQRQRLLIARALAPQPQILLLDEATSALDNRTQALVSDSLDALRVTRIVIAHRLSTIRHADRIVVLDRGRVVQSGRFSELLAAGGAFGELARRQMV
jgi:NHLM bacteriocin system ABC transporter ATP-binding protein